jgi:hypothetical protein
MTDRFQRGDRPPWRRGENAQRGAISVCLSTPAKLRWCGPWQRPSAARWCPALHPNAQYAKRRRQWQSLCWSDVPRANGSCLCPNPAHHSTLHPADRSCRLHLHPVAEVPLVSAHPCRRGLQGVWPRYWSRPLQTFQGPALKQWFCNLQYAPCPKLFRWNHLSTLSAAVKEL